MIITTACNINIDVNWEHECCYGCQIWRDVDIISNESEDNDQQENEINGGGVSSQAKDRTPSKQNMVGKKRTVDQMTKAAYVPPQKSSSKQEQAAEPVAQTKKAKKVEAAASQSS